MSDAQVDSTGAAPAGSGWPGLLSANRISNMRWEARPNRLAPKASTCSGDDSSRQPGKGPQARDARDSDLRAAGGSGVWHGERLEHHTIVKPG